MNGTLGTRDGRGVYRGIAAVGGTVSPTLDPSERKAVIPALATSLFVYYQPRTMGEMGKGTGDWCESRQ